MIKNSNIVFGEDVKVAVIGFGSIGRKHIESIKKYRPESKIFLLTKQDFDPNYMLEKKAYKRSINDLLKVEPNIFVISSPSSDHGLFVKKIAAKDKLVLIEKPLSATSKGAETIIKHFKGNSFSPIVAYNLRFSKAFSLIKEYLKSKRIGKILSYHCVVGQDLNQWRPGRLIDKTPSALRAKGGGVLRELSHEFDYLSVLFGTPSNISAMLGRQKFQKFDVEDTAILSFRYKKNYSEIIGSLNLDFTRQDATRFCHIIGTEGTIKWNLLTGKIVLIMQGLPHQVIYDFCDDIKFTNSWMWQDILSGDFTRFCSLKNAHDTIALIERIESKQI